ncbi:hypothetical protein [Streptomyces sp. H27-D2]|uniref:hypothetical protein n=1 Tax=Streptomyces sp. H27-D2 TaxID=3046304 RepID=UPI002DB78EDF|nr:hypothetical protein [Streptomyces sp. H27-D2]MEC4015703.1 hypothetical protein [Streptomyces sp. H27-D2]
MTVQRYRWRGRVVAVAVAGGLVAGLSATGCSRPGAGGAAEATDAADAARAADADVAGRADGAAGPAGAAGEKGPGAGGSGAGGSADPVATMHRTAAVLVRSGSSTVRTSLEMASGGTRVTIRGEGGFDYGKRLGRLRVTLPPDAAGADEHRPIIQLLAPGALYMKNRGAGVPADKWVRVDTTELADGNLVTGGATDPLSAAELLRGAREVSCVGERRTGGETVRHFRGTTDIARAAKAASARTRPSLAAAAKGFARDTVAFDAYVDERGRLRKLEQRFSFVNDEGRVAVVASTIELSGFGTPVTVELPPEREIYTGKVAAPGE